MSGKKAKQQRKNLKWNTENVVNPFFNGALTAELQRFRTLFGEEEFLVAAANGREEHFSVWKLHDSLDEFYHFINHNGLKSLWLANLFYGTELYVGKHTVAEVCDVIILVLDAAQGSLPHWNGRNIAQLHFELSNNHDFTITAKLNSKSIAVNHSGPCDEPWLSLEDFLDVADWVLAEVTG